MHGCFLLVTQEKLDSLHADPETITNFLNPMNEEEDPSNSDDWIDIDKTWQGLHFLLTGTDWDGTHPLDFIAHGGTRIGEIELSYGPVRGFNSKEVAEISAAISSLDEAVLRSRFRPEMMQDLEIYPDIWDRDEDENLDYLLQHWRDLKAFVAIGARRGNAMLVYLA